MKTHNTYAASMAADDMTTEDQQELLDSFRQRALLVEFHGSMYYNKKIDRKLTRKLRTDTGAAYGTVEVSKRLLDGWRELKQAQACVRRARQVHKKHALPWKTGQQILPTKLQPVWSDALRACKLELETEHLPAMRDTYADAVAADMQRLDGAASASDYDTVEVMISKFDITWTDDIVPDLTADPRLEVSDATRARLQRKAIDGALSKANTTIAGVWQRVHDVLDTYADNMTSYDPQNKKKSPFRDSTVEAVRELVGLLPALNVHGDKKLDKLAEDLQRKLLADADTLRKDTLARKTAGEEARKLADTAGGMLERLGIIGK